jgi:hypothetical protein
MSATELIERFNHVLRLTQDAWQYDGRLQGMGNTDLAKIEKLRIKLQTAEAAAEEFCQLLSDNESA